jgi:hypothetical protein
MTHWHSISPAEHRLGASKLDPVPFLSNSHTWINPTLAQYTKTIITTMLEAHNKATHPTRLIGLFEDTTQLRIQIFNTQIHTLCRFPKGTLLLTNPNPSRPLSVVVFDHDSLSHPNVTPYTMLLLEKGATQPVNLTAFQASITRLSVSTPSLSQPSCPNPR